MLWATFSLESQPSTHNSAPSPPPPRFPQPEFFGTLPALDASYPGIWEGSEWWGHGQTEGQTDMARDGQPYTLLSAGLRMSEKQTSGGGGGEREDKDEESERTLRSFPPVSVCACLQH